MGEKVLVTGGAGFIGSHLCERLLELGYEIRILDNLWRGNLRNIKKVKDQVDLISGDIRNYKIVKKSVKGVDTIFHLASINGTKHFYESPCLVLDVGIKGMMNLTRAIGEKRIHIIFASSSEIYGESTKYPTSEKEPAVIHDITNPRFSYSLQKIASEVIGWNYSKKKGFDLTVLRLFNVYGPRMGWDHVMPEFIKKIVLDEEFTMHDKISSTRCFCYISDIINCFILALKKRKNDIFNIGNPNEEVTIQQLFDLLKKISGKKIEPKLVQSPEGQTTRRYPDISKAEKILGYKPKIPLERGLKETYKWYEKEITWMLKNQEETLPW